MTSLRAHSSVEEFGFFQIIATTTVGKKINISRFRGAPVQINDISTRDPFGDALCSLSLQQVTIFDKPGQGDLVWLKPYTHIDIRLVPAKQPRPGVPDEDKSDSEIITEKIEGNEDNPIPGMEPPNFYHIPADPFTPDEEQNLYLYPLKHWKWEGYIASYDVNSSSGLSIQCKGALYQLDNYLSKPLFPRQPIPYEILLKQSFNPHTHPGLATNPLHIAFPENWKKQGLFSTEAKPGYLQPFGISPGEDWTGLTSRSTGAWENTLTGFVQGLLSVMFTDNGSQWTIYKLPGRQPLLKLRREPEDINGATLVVNAENPGVDFSISRDFTQSVNMIYGSGNDLAGITFSGQKVTPDGKDTYYEPFAYAPQVYPAERQNKLYDPRVVMPKEGLLQFPQGLNELDSREVANQQYARFADPGFTGTITLKADPKYRGIVYPRYLIQAGMSIAVNNLLGHDHVVLHIVECSIDIDAGVVTLQVDSKFRDQLTWKEVRARTRDALIPLRALQVGQYSNLLQDLLKPWSYRDGSGVIPSGRDYDATKFFNDIVPNGADFPYEEWTRKRPPKDPGSRPYYIKVPGRDPEDASNNWGGTTRKNSKYVGAFVVKASQAATIRLTQIAAYDRHGNVKKADFHVSFYLSRGTAVTSMPKIPDEPDIIKKLPHKYKAGQYYPFFKTAWESVDRQGIPTRPFFYTAPGSDLLVGWGNYWEPAGYWPGLKSAKDKKTGLLVDESNWSFDCSQQPGWDMYDKHANQKNSTVGVLYCMIYCDEDTEPTYFMGRLFRSEPGAA